MADTLNPLLRRDIDFIPVTGEDGVPVVVARDPLELFDGGSVALQRDALPILALMDGSRSAEEIRLELEARSASAGQVTVIPKELIDSFLEQLDRAYLLDSPRFRQAHRGMVDKFLALTDRPPALGGRAYPDSKTELISFLDDILSEKTDGKKKAELEDKEIISIVAPHIEITQGKKLFAASYNALRGASYDRVVVLGVGHSLETGLFSLTMKNHITPLGTVQTDRQAVEALRQATGFLAAPDDFCHRREHSIEFQVIFLQHVLEGPFTLVPILCGSLHEHLIAGGKARPREIDNFPPVLDCLAGLLADPNQKTLVVAGVDFSHVGNKFGDKLPAASITSDSTAHDMALLAALEKLDVEAFCTESRRAGDRYHVCGFSALSILLEILPEGARGIQLGHEVWNEAPTRSAVSYAAAAFFSAGK
ncbi:MAG: AmmeMemoRadiSam system protein B [Gemmatimonadota bacterium]|nr:AmmeMemoRadiSam system protein B [Gemmatimonadota bacterium]